MMPINVSDVTNWLKSQQQFNQIALEWVGNVGDRGGRWDRGEGGGPVASTSTS